MRFDDRIRHLRKGTSEIADLSEYLGKVTNPSARKEIIMVLRAGGIISDLAAEILIEHHRLEAA